MLGATGHNQPLHYCYMSFHMKSKKQLNQGHQNWYIWSSWACCIQKVKVRGHMAQKCGSAHLCLHHHCTLL